MEMAVKQTKELGISRQELTKLVNKAKASCPYPGHENRDQFLKYIDCEERILNDGAL